MPNQKSELPEDIRKDIDNYMAQNHPFVWPKNKHGEDMVQPVGHVHPPFWRKHQNQIAPIRAAAEHYAALYLDSERRRKEAMELLEPILDWGQGNPELKLGTSITKEVLERAKGFSVLRDALEAIYNLPGYRQDEASQLASEALALFPVDKNNK